MMIEFESTSLERHLRAIVRKLDFSYWALSTGELVISHGQAGSTLVFVSQTDDVVVHLHTTLRGAVDLGEAAALSRFITSWNADCLYPTAVLDYDEEGSLCCVGRATSALELHQRTINWPLLCPPRSAAQRCSLAWRRANFRPWPKNQSCC